jgi:Protein of unknown function (DUF3137)
MRGSENLTALFQLLLFGRINTQSTLSLEAQDFKKYEGFAEHVQTRLAPHVADFEMRRIKALKDLRQRFLIGAILFGVAAYLGVLFFSVNETFRTFITSLDFDAINIVIFVFVAFMGWAWAIVGRHYASVKTEIFPYIFSYFGPQYVYQPTPPFTVASLEHFDVLPSYDDEQTEDYVSGEYKGVGIELLEARLTRETHGKNRRTVEVFRGMFILLEMNKNFIGKTIVKSDSSSFLDSWFGKSYRDLEAVELEDPEFEKLYDAFSTDQIEARRLLTPAVMERIRALNDLPFVSSMLCSFFEGRVLFMLPTNKNHFEPTSIFEPIDFSADMQQILEEMQAIFNIIDILKLDQRTGL